MKLFTSRPTIIAGLGRRGATLAADFCRHGHRITVIEQAPSSADHVLARRLGFKLVIGNASAPETLREAGIRNAERLIALCGEDNTNIEIALESHELRKAMNPNSPPLACHVHIYDRRLEEALQRYGMERLRDRIGLQFFNVYEQTARRLAQHYPLHEDRLTDSGLREHFILIGFGHFGRQVLLKFVRLGHLANGLRPRFTIIDRLASQNGRRFSRRNPEVQKLCELSFIDLATTDREVIDFSFLGDRAGETRETPIICFDNDPLCFATAIDLLPACAERHIPFIWTRLAEQRGVAHFLSNTSPTLQLSRVRPFGGLHEVLRASAFLDDPLDRFARKRHESYCQEEAAKGTVAEENPSMRSWDELSQDLRNANREQADHAYIKLRTLGYRLEYGNTAHNTEPMARFQPSAEEVEMLARMEHNRWMADKLLSGWRYSQVANPELKFHDNLVPYEELPEEAREKDRDTVRHLVQELEASGFRIVRTKSV